MVLISFKIVFELCSNCHILKKIFFELDTLQIRVVRVSYTC